jgi:hypothetical protein
VLADRGDWVHRDYEKVMRTCTSRSSAAKRSNGRWATRALLDAPGRSAQLQHAHDELRDALAQREDALAKSEAESACAPSDLSARRNLGARLRWWLRLLVAGILR